MTTLLLPLPPSVNHNKINGRYNTRQAVAWKIEAGQEINIQLVGRRPPTLTGPVALNIRMEDHGDIDNRLKPLLDLLQEHRLYINDRQVKRLLVEMGGVIGCEVTVSPIDGNLKNP